MKNSYIRKGMAALLAVAVFSLSVIGEGGFYGVKASESQVVMQEIEQETESESIEKSAGTTQPEEAEKSTGATQSEGTGKSTGATQPEEEEKSTGATQPEEEEKSTGATQPEGTGKSTEATQPEEEEKSTGATQLEEAEKSTGEIPTENTEEPTGEIPTENTEEPTGEILPEDTEKSEEETETLNESTAESEWEQLQEQMQNQIPEQMTEQVSDLIQEQMPEETTEQIPDPLAESETEVTAEEALDESMELLELELLEEEEQAATLLADAYTPPGTIASAAGSGYTVVTGGDRRYSGNYCEVQRNSSSTVIPWDNSGGNVTQGTRTNTGGQTYTYFVPKNNSAAGKFGFRVTNVAYNRTEKCSVDLIITVVAYNDFTYSSAGNKIEDVYPCIGYTPGGGIAYQPFLPAIRLKCELVKSGTNTLIAGDYRFTMTDIDAGQIYGITLFDGTIDARYCTASTVINTGMRSLSDGRNYYMMYAPDIACSEGNKNHAISYEVSGMSSFGIFIDSEKRSGTVGGYSASTVRTAYADVKDGEWTGKGALMGWDSWAFGPPEVCPVNKYVSTDGVSWGVENSLPFIDSEFWYMLEVYVPEMSGYSYQQFYLKDQLPDGVDYVGEFSAVKMETGGNASGFFDVSGSDELVIAYNGTSGFPGYTYQMRFKVKMDPTEITPVLNGTTAVYSAENQAVLWYQTNVDTSVLSTDSNSVVTTARKEKETPQKPEKKINWNGSMLESKEYGTRKEEIVFTIKQKIPAYEPCWYMDSFLFEDTLEPCLELVKVALGTEKNPGSTVFEVAQSGTVKNGWSFTRENQKITAKLNSDGIKPEHFDGTTIYRMDLTVRIKDGYDLFGYYKQVSDGKQMSVIPNQGESRFVWGSEMLRLETNQVNVMISEVFGTAEVIKINENTGETITNAGFTLYQWNKTKWEKVETFYYDKNAKKYRLKNYLLRTEANQGKFKITEHETPQGFLGSWEQEFVLDGTSGVCETIVLQASNKMATGRISVKKTSELGSALAGAKYEVCAKEHIVSPNGKILYAAGTKVTAVTTGADGSATTDELYPGTYEVRETQPPAGYTLNQTPQEVSIVYVSKDAGASHETVTFQNRQTLVYLSKVSVLAPEENKKKVLSGVSFAIWNKNTENEQSAVVYKTDQEGRIALKGYVPGTYCYKETVTPNGYVPDSVIREFTIDQNGYCSNQEACVIEIENQYICAEFAKKDKATGAYISGAKLQLTDQNGNVKDTWTSDTVPHKIYRIAAGVYTLTELEAPPGYKKAEPMQIEIREVEEVQSFSMYDVKYVTVTLGKSILKDEVVWAHGNPTFTFCLEGTDLDGEKHTYYETVEFTPEHYGADNPNTDGTVSAFAVFTVPAGEYTACEMNVIRYKLEKIDGAVNGVISGPAVLFDLCDNGDGCAVFHNRKTNDTGLSETDFVRNIVIE